MSAFSISFRFKIPDLSINNQKVLQVYSFVNVTTVMIHAASQRSPPRMAKLNVLDAQLNKEGH